jgi:hypothetical protein
MTQKESIVGDETVGSPIYAREGDVVPYAIPISGASTVTTPTMYFYKEGSTTDVTNTYFAASPTMSVSGTVIITRTPQNLKQGRWVLSIWAIVDGYNQNVRTYPFIVKRKSEL